MPQKPKRPNVTFIDYIRASYPILWIQTHEEQRALQNLVIALNDYNKAVGEKKGGAKKSYVYDLVSGLHQVFVDDKNMLVINQKPLQLDAKPGQEKQKGPDPSMPIKWLDPFMMYDEANLPPKETDPNFGDKMHTGSIIFLKGFSHFLSDKFKDSLIIKRMILNSLSNYKLHGKTLVILSPEMCIPNDMEKEITVVDFKLPNRDELKMSLKNIAEGAGTKYPTDTEEAIVDAALGMTTIEAESAFAVSLVKTKSFDPDLIRSEKAKIIKKSDLLEVVESVASMDDIGGLDRLKNWLINRKESFTEEAKRFGVEPPKGMLLIGVPGCGKSLTAKAVATAWGRPLLRLDMGRVFGRYVGDSEGNVQAVLKLAEAVAPCVLWIDELEKSLAGNKGGGNESHETTRRVFQILLTWMQEHTADVFLAATANSITCLPPELLRAGRIDVTFWVDLPQPAQAWEILGIHLRKKNFNPADYEADKDLILSKLDKFSGAEIEVTVKEAITRAFASGRKPLKLLTEDIIESAETITPIAVLQKADIEASRTQAMQMSMQLASTPLKVEEKTNDDTPSPRTRVAGGRRIDKD